MIATDISGAAALPPVPSPHQSSEFDAQPGTLHLSVPYTARWEATVNGQEIPVRPAFGLTNAYDIKSAGKVRLSFATSWIHTVLIFVQALVWIGVLFVATSRKRFMRRKKSKESSTVVLEPALTFSDGEKS